MGLCLTRLTHSSLFTSSIIEEWCSHLSVYLQDNLPDGGRERVLLMMHINKYLRSPEVIIFTFIVEILFTFRLCHMSLKHNFFLFLHNSIEESHSK